MGQVCKCEIGKVNGIKVGEAGWGRVGLGWGSGVRAGARGRGLGEGGGWARLSDNPWELWELVLCCEGTHRIRVTVREDGHLQVTSLG